MLTNRSSWNLTFFLLERRSTTSPLVNQEGAFEDSSLMPSVPIPHRLNTLNGFSEPAWKTNTPQSQRLCGSKPRLDVFKPL